MFIYEMGNPVPIGDIGPVGSQYWIGPNSGSVCYSGVMDYEHLAFPSTSVNTVAEHWVCHYCGSIISVDRSNCPNCGGEKRRPIEHNHGHVNIEYVRDNIPQVVLLPKSRGILERLKGMFGV